MTRATPEMIAAAWDAWHSRHGGKLGPGPAFVEAINAALNKMQEQQTMTDPTGDALKAYSTPSPVSNVKGLLTCQCVNTITDPCIVCGKGKTLVTAEWLQKMAAKEGDLDCTTGRPAPASNVRDFIEMLTSEIGRLRQLHRSSFMSDVGRRAMLDHFEQFIGALPAEPTSAPAQHMDRDLLPIWLEGGLGDRLADAMQAHLKDYVYSPDEGWDHEPTDFERVLLEDFLNGALATESVNAILQEAARSALPNAPAPVSNLSGWQPIDTAPLDKTRVIIAVPTKDRDDWIIGEASFDPEHYDGGDWWWANLDHSDYHAGPVSECNHHAPEFWQPLPAPPATTEGSDNG